MAGIEEVTVIEEDELAVVVTADDSWKILVPRDENADVTEKGMVLLAIAIWLSTNAGFYEDMLELAAGYFGVSEVAQE